MTGEGGGEKKEEEKWERGREEEKERDRGSEGRKRTKRVRELAERCPAFRGIPTSLRGGGGRREGMRGASPGPRFCFPFCLSLPEVDACVARDGECVSDWRIIVV